ncbi:lipoprotein NlpD [Bathymodiolus platifrons methanotrophic gill symbiont]|nr:lipoprotein NlpD [Bathymodiolus platifrons methanotrophic gill symbiont]
MDLSNENSIIPEPGLPFGQAAALEKQLRSQLCACFPCTAVHPKSCVILSGIIKPSSLSVYMRLTYRAIIFVIIVLCVAGCASTQSKAPVQPHKRDLTKGSYYVVKKGDTLYAIGFRSGHGYKRLAAWNKIRPPYKVYQGQKLKLFRGTKPRKTQKKKKSNKKRSSISINNKKVLRLYWQWPVRGKLLRSFYQTGNKGIDISGRVGRKVRAAATGIVVYSGSGLVGYGKLLIIKHNYLYLSAYAHNRRLLVKEGQKVKKGQVVAEVGIGVNAKPALHFEIRKNGKSVNPINYLPK